MKRLFIILTLVLAAGLVFADEPESEKDSLKSIEVVRDESTGAMTVGAKKSVEETSFSHGISSESREDKFDVGGFLRELFDAASVAAPEADIEIENDYRESVHNATPASGKSAKESAPSIDRPVARTLSSKRTKSYDTFRDDNDNGIDDRLEEVNTVSTKRNK